jgi:hypothetical protein
MNVIAHQAVREHSAPREILIHPHVDAELLFLLLPKRELPVNDSVDDVINDRSFVRIFPRSEPACFSHRFDDFEEVTDKDLTEAREE